MNPSNPHTLATELEAAFLARQTIQPFTNRFLFDLPQAYAVQLAWNQLRLQAGDQVVGHKIGLTQQASQIDEPDYGTLLDDMLYTCTPGQVLDIPTTRFIAPRVEVELAFILKRALQPEPGQKVSIDDVLDATECVTPAIEIIDSRIEQFDRHTKVMRQVFDTISDFAANAGIVLGGRPVRPDAIDLRWSGAMLSRNGVIEETGLGAGVLGHPAQGIAWLAAKLAPWDERLEAGDVVLAGSFTRPVAGAVGDTFHADYGPLGVVSFRFA